MQSIFYLFTRKVGLAAEKEARLRGGDLIGYRAASGKNSGLMFFRCPRNRRKEIQPIYTRLWNKKEEAFHSSHNPCSLDSHDFETVAKLLAACRNCEAIPIDVNHPHIRSLGLTWAYWLRKPRG